MPVAEGTEVETAEDAEATAAKNALDDGRSIDDLAADDDAEPEEIAPTQMALPGYETGLSLAIGGDKPTASKVQIMGSSRDVEGQFKKGDRIRMVVEGVVGGVHLDDSHDNYGSVTGTVRKHLVRPISIQIIRTPADDPTL